MLIHDLITTTCLYPEEDNSFRSESVPCRQALWQKRRLFTPVDGPHAKIPVNAGLRLSSVTVNGRLLSMAMYQGPRKRSNHVKKGNF